ncbi:hypothetical protein D3C80_2123970 [compost metagenome]
MYLDCLVIEIITGIGFRRAGLGSISGVARYHGRSCGICHPLPCHCIRLYLWA